MNALPVVQRELRAQSRQVFTYWLRVIGAAAVVAMTVFFVANVGLRPDAGAELFSYLHGILHGSIWLLVPLLCADCLSRERREGTLGLLFLTPLKAHDIVLAKGVVHGLRAATLLLAAVPVAMLPALIGGVSWRQVTASVAINSTAVCLALAASLLASASSKSWMRSLLAAYMWSSVFAVGMCYALLKVMTLLLGRAALFNIWHGFQLALGINPEFFLASYYYRSGAVFMKAATSNQLFHAVMAASLVVLVVAVIFFVVVLLIAAFAASRSWQDRPPHQVVTKLKEVFCTPMMMQHVLKRWMRHTIEHNPIGWLERRVWSGRLVIWGWFAVMISVYSMLLGNASYLYRALDTIHVLMGTLLTGSLALNSASSFRREREARVLELLLVSPIKEWQIIGGRLRGLWGQFLPSIVLLFTGWIYLATATTYGNNSFALILQLAIALTAIPVIGLYFSLVCRSLIAAVTWTFLVGLVLPMNSLALVKLALALMYWHGSSHSLAPVLNTLLHPALIQAVLGGVLVVRLHRRLVQRNFATESV
jgi:hypothetical protein